MAKERVIGKCLLTTNSGFMAKSHIIPQAFLQRATEAPFMQWTPGEYPKKSYIGWYDQNILTDEGEAITAQLDDVAAKCFIHNDYTYRTRRDPIDINFIRGDFTEYNIYEIENIDSAKMHLFAISMLWRAAVSSHPAFQNVNLSASHMEDIRKRIISGDPGAPTEYPTYFGVFCGPQELSKINPYKPRNFPYYRFFMDGVVCYVSPTRRLNPKRNLGLLLAGSEPNRIRVVAYPSIGSLQEDFTERSYKQLFEQHGDVFAKFKGAVTRRR